MCVSVCKSCEISKKKKCKDYPPLNVEKATLLKCWSQLLEICLVSFDSFCHWCRRLPLLYLRRCQRWRYSHHLQQRMQLHVRPLHSPRTAHCLVNFTTQFCGCSNGSQCNVCMHSKGGCAEWGLMTHTQTKRERNQIRVVGLFTIESLYLFIVRKINRSTSNKHLYRVETRSTRLRKTIWG